MLLFDNLPKITYDSKNTINIMTRAAIRSSVLKNYKVYYPYKIVDGERPDTIAHDYYDDATFDWLVCLANNIVDVYSQWPKSYNAFLDYLQDKYGYVNHLMSEIHHYKFTGENNSRITHHITTETYGNMTTFERIGWVPVYTYDWELELNEKKRDIRLLSSEYIGQIKTELATLFK